MPYDKNNNTTQNKPLLPRVANPKSPLTPRLAAQHIRLTQSPSTITNPPRVVGIVSTTIKDDLNTPTKSFLSNNITPRSSSRKLRIEANSTHSTPTTTPTQTPIQDQSGKSKFPVAIPNNTVHKRPKSVVLDANGIITSPIAKSHTFSPTSTPGNASPREINSSNFFHASEAKNLEKAPQPKKAATFFYANGVKKSNEDVLPNRAPSPSLSTMSTKSHKSQFYRADGTLDGDDVPPLPMSPNLQRSPESKPCQPSSVISPFSIRPPSPQKMGLHLTYRKGASQIISPQNRSQAVPILPPSSSSRPQSPNRQEKSPPMRFNHTPRSHGRAGSLSSIDSSPSSRKSSLAALDTSHRHSPYAMGDIPTSAPASARMIPPTSNPSLSEIVQDIRPDSSNSNQSRPGSVSLSYPQSPNQLSQQSAPTPFAEAASNARRERKVLDLEISNSSLLAINRQLEREVRRQKNDLRRFRRLSRARLTSLSSMIPDDEDDESSEHDKELGDFSDHISDSEDEDDPDSSISEESLASTNVSSTSFTQRNAVRLEKDEKRLQLDLKKHRQLLVDSQKMNQSLKRCMAISEEMIAEGRRALEYRVSNGFISPS
jgi:hypothetical protein